MKTIVNKLRFALLLGFFAVSMTAWSQGVPYINKMSITTQMFLDEMAGRISFEQEIPTNRFTSPGVRPMPKLRRPIASPDTIEGNVYIASTIRITNNSVLTELESKGVIIQCTFDKGLVTTLIPIDRIEDVATIEGVTRINVSAVMRPLTNLARQTTNVNDVLAYSNDAITAGLPHGYDGTGVILGIIDDGIDFQHKAFTDKNGNTRIKGAYCYNGSQVTADWTGSGTLPTTDDSEEDHGTHTSSIAGGSSVIVSGTNVTVTDDHANATYGGMAPGADLYLAGTQLYTSYILNAFQKMSNYADAQGKPLVVSNSWGSSTYARDGYSDMSDVFAQYFGENHPNRICTFASGNEAGMGLDGMGGGRYVTGTSTEASPLGTIIRTTAWIENYYNYQYVGGSDLVNAWTRATNAQGIGVNIHVINKNTGALYQSYSYKSTTSGASQSITLAGINMSATLYFDYVTSPGRHQALLYGRSTISSSNNYVLAVEVYPIGGSSNIVDIYGGDYTYLTNYVSTSGHNWVNGSDDQSMGDEAMDPNVISVGSYVTRNGINSTGDISDFSSYATEGSGPTGAMHPWITAPGEVIISGYNHYVSSSNHSSLVVNNSAAPYGEMSGSSMASPMVAGIVALWFQAAQEVGKTLTLSDVKTIMAETAIKDSWVTSGPHANHFGNGKIDALAGIEYILREYGEPTITANPSSITFEGAPGGTYTKTITVGGLQLTDDIIAELNDPNGVYSINRSVNLGSGGDLVINYAPSSEGTHNATITLTSNGATDKTVTITGRASNVVDATVCDGTTTNTYLPIYGNQYANKQINQMIYPASLLTEIQGKKIKAMRFYAERINFSGGAFTVKMGTTTQTTFARTGYSRITADMTTVKTGQAAVSGGTELVITFDQPFEYTDGNLVIDFEVTATNTNSTTRFYGVTQNGYTSFYSYGGNINQYGRYSSGGTRLQFLPKVTFEWDAPYVAGEISSNSVSFTDVPISTTQNATITVTNTGTLPFTPVIDTTDLPSEFSVTGNGNLQPDGTINLTVSYTPTDEGPHSGSFTVTIGSQTYTVTVTGNGIVVTSTLTSNTVVVPVFKSEAQGIDNGTAYQVSDIDNDIHHLLPVGDGNGDVRILVVGDNNITHYELNRQNGGSEWTVVAVANNDDNTYTQQGYSENTVTVADGATAWMDIIDDAAISTTNATYVPVTHALSVQQQDNTYGAPRQNKVITDLSSVVQSIVMSSENAGGTTWTVDDKVYTHYTILLDIDRLIIPTSSDDPTKDYDLYKVRAWRKIDPSLLKEQEFPMDGPNAGKNREERVTEDGDFMFEELNHAEYSLTSVNDLDNQYYLGDNENLTRFYPNWTKPGSYEVMATFGAQKLREDAEETGVLESLPMIFTVRAYYTRTANLSSIGLRDGETAADGNYYILEYVLPFTLNADDPQIVTAVGSVLADRQVIGVTYVNTMGMQSSQPFDGLNIVVTRYSDGSATMTKVIK